MIEQGALAAFFSLSHSLDLASQRYSALGLCNLALGDGEERARMVQEGCIRPLMFLCRYPDLVFTNCWIKIIVLFFVFVSLCILAYPFSYSPTSQFL